MLDKHHKLEAVGAPLLAPEEPPAFDLINPEGSAPYLLICDHASPRIPASLDKLGLDEAALAEHIAWDIGIRDVARRLVERYDVTLVQSAYSRLVIDLNRYPNHPSATSEQSGDVFIPGNHDLGPADVLHRADALFWPYHNAVSATLQRFLARGRVPAIISLHSFTPEYRGFRRPWHVGVLWHRDGRMAAPLLAGLEAIPGLCVGDNEPYSAKSPLGYSMDVHGMGMGLPHVLVEIRQDLIGQGDGAIQWADRLGALFAGILAQPGLLKVDHHAAG